MESDKIEVILKSISNARSLTRLSGGRKTESANTCSHSRSHRNRSVREVDRAKQKHKKLGVDFMWTRLSSGRMGRTMLICPSTPGGERLFCQSPAKPSATHAASVLKTRLSPWYLDFLPHRPSPPLVSVSACHIRPRSRGACCFLQKKRAGTLLEHLAVPADPD